MIYLHEIHTGSQYFKTYPNFAGFLTIYFLVNVRRKENIMKTSWPLALLIIAQVKSQHKYKSILETPNLWPSYTINHPNHIAVNV